jgi:uncharacterized membrane protein
MNSVESFLTATEEQEIVQAIQKAEFNTSGEIRVHIEKITSKDVMDRAKEVFFDLKMNQTKDRNGILLYVATDSKKFAILGDSGIDQKVPSHFWQDETDMIIGLFAQKQNCLALTKGIEKVGEKLKAFFPYQSDDRNELTNEISKG